MPRIESTTEVSAPLERVWQVARDVEAFPEFMPDLKSLTLKEKSPDGLRTVTEWVGIIKEFKRTVKWVEEDVWDPAERTCRFRMLSGDFDSYGGVWTFEEKDDKVLFHSVVDFEYNVPLIGPLSRNIVTVKMKQNADNIVEAIGRKAEEA